jgi:hypothetical protein
VVASEAASARTCVGTLVKSIGQLYAGKPHVQLEEGAPVGCPWRDIQALSTERDSPSYGPPKDQSDRALLTGRPAGNRLDKYRIVCCAPWCCCRIGGLGPISVYSHGWAQPRSRVTSR